MLLSGARATAEVAGQYVEAFQPLDSEYNRTLDAKTIVKYVWESFKDGLGSFAGVGRKLEQSAAQPLYLGK